MMCREKMLRPLIALTVLLMAAGCSEEKSSTPAAASPVVEVVTIEARPFVLSSELPGRIEPVRVAEVRARVAGIVLSRHFREGADVKAGDVLFRIDPAPFKAALSRAEGALAQADASLFEARSVVGRYEPLVKIEAVSKQVFDTALAALKSAEAARKSALAAVETAKLDLGYATVTAPISGRIGRALVTEGALVGQGEATPMATIQQLDPIYADFKQSVADMLRMRAALESGQLARKDDKSALISITTDGMSGTRDGRLLFSDVTVDRGTGQVSLRGLFDNPDALLLPGMYVRVHLPQGIDPAAILVPQRAVRRGVDGSAQVLVVGSDDVLEARTVRTGAMQGKNWHITEGLRPGERVVVGGAGILQPGAKVTIAASDPAAPQHR